MKKLGTALTYSICTIAFIWCGISVGQLGTQLLQVGPVIHSLSTN